MPENTLPAFEKAIKLGADGLELDVHLSTDKQLIVYHDYSFEKLGINENIADMTLEEIKKIKFNKNVSIPTLDEVLDIFGNKVLLNIEIKAKTAATAVSEKLMEYDIRLEPENLMVSSFHVKPLEDLKNINKKIPTGYLTVFPWKSLGTAKKLNCAALHPFYDKPPHYWQKLLIDVFTKRLIENSLKEGLNVNLWTVNDDTYIKNALKLNVTSIITDKLRLALEIKKEWEKGKQ